MGPAPVESALQSLLPPTLFDDGGVWEPGTLGINTTGRPELVLNPAQFAAATQAPDRSMGGTRYGDVIIQNLTAADADDVGKQIARQQRLQIMRYSGRT